jgi:hypothetical protein
MTKIIMEESLICECGNQNFWFFWGYARCTKCFNEYKYEWYEDWSSPGGGFGGIESQSGPQFWMRRFDIEKNQYHDNWEKSKLTYKGINNE